MERTLWESLPLLVRANSKESVEYILQAIWRTRKTGLDNDDRRIICDMLQLQDDADLDPLLVCLRILIRRCVFQNVNKDEIQKLFPEEVLPELQKLLTILLQKYDKEWQNDVVMETAAVPQLESITWSMTNQVEEDTEPMAVINLKLEKDVKSSYSKDSEVKFHIDKDNIGTLVKSMYAIRDQFTETG